MPVGAPRAAMDLGGLLVRPRRPAGEGGTDPLTGLPGRGVLERRTADALQRGRSERRGVGLVVCGVDRLSTVNYRLGRDGGDEVLRLVAERLGRVVTGRGTLHRLAGDEFALLVEDLRHPGDLRSVAAGMLRAVRHPLTTGRGDMVATSVSLGVASVGWDGAERDLLREADLAMHRAKDAGRDRVVVFDERLRAHAESAAEAERRLRAALRDGELRLHLQPIVDLATGDQVASEGLVRLVDSHGAVTMPSDFISVAEDRGLVSEIDRWALARGVALLAADVVPAVTVNLSARTFDRIDVPGRVVAAVEERGVDPSRLHLEITESTLAASETTVVQALEQLRAFGCGIAVDDFGTGYSSLAHLAGYPADTLKIDRSFVQGLGRTTREDAVVQAVIAIAHAHDMLVVAEGVERQEQARQLLAMGCDRAQGWYFGRPVDPRSGSTG
ncbi:putative bifunctional diguanylate cyclase/phosphodiesterase [Aquipuribacter nitratireducens]|uniref:Bifunctional diguanylate cyclase/phosphodiesterase n=1 Tax=Aquipuribacter nitratireducens TaxID=650104 RepID=A0ABW0GLL0_9MICO